MGSIVMHLCASNEANKILKFDTKRFLIGSIAPDIHKISGGNYFNSHYLMCKNKDEKDLELPNLNRFAKENFEKIINDDFHKGYYSHLIADNIWYKDFNSKYVDKLSNDKTQIKLVGQTEYISYESYRNQIYSDYTTLNSMLLQKYNIDVNLLYNIVILDMKTEDLNTLLERNTTIKEDYDLENLNIIKLNDIFDFIEKSKKEIINKLQGYVK